MRKDVAVYLFVVLLHDIVAHMLSVYIFGQVCSFCTKHVLKTAVCRV